ncbi:RNA polymerase sigma-70 factor (ECF subfamily) [Thermonema lapsum]|uniref:RNA polymerase sigma-70 factor (ECF subfamily) n=1 Tax=Thermonema lapsum TaxID=28195 RepID=A0A846MRI3_9BACT|nr:RNA polymerase sigma factor [Thermonema lapsum]NIK74268.1 RNA polymerase sigma-70 factor (ECF subfamily) [Thermonema lapsum]
MNSTSDFGHILQEAAASLRPFAFRMVKDKEAVDDLIQETLYKALNNKDKFSAGTNLKAWLYTIMKNTFISQYQKNSRRQTFVDTTENQHFINSGERIAYNDALSNLSTQEIIDAIESLAEHYRVPFLMYYRGFKYQEIAERLDIPIGTVKNRIHIARKQLKEKLSKA